MKGRTWVLPFSLLIYKILVSIKASVILFLIGNRFPTTLTISIAMAQATAAVRESTPSFLYIKYFPNVRWHFHYSVKSCILTVK